MMRLCGLAASNGKGFKRHWLDSVMTAIDITDDAKQQFSFGG